MEAGAQAVSQMFPSDPSLHPSKREHRTVVGLFDLSFDLKSIRDHLCAKMGWMRLPDHGIDRIDDRDWVRAWADHFQPLRFGSRLWVCPTTCEPPDPDAVNVILDPGLGFGTGAHATTALCLEWLDGHDLRGVQVIDYGCGSGILAVAAAKLGAGRVWAVDIDPLALEASAHNVDKNQVGDRVVVTTPESLPSDPVDVLTANILSGPLIDLAPHFARHVRPSGRIILAGILDRQARQVQAAYQPWFEMDAPVLRDDWVRLEGRRNHVDLASLQGGSAAGVADPDGGQTLLP